MGSKSALLDCFSSSISNESAISKLNADGYVLDGPVVVHMLKPGLCKTFEDYRAKLFIPYLLSMLNSVSRLDVVIDVYVARNLKKITRDNRGFVHQNACNS